MCGYSLEHVQSRPAKVGEKLRVTNFGMGTRGFASSSDLKTAVCIKPGTEIAFPATVALYGRVGRMPFSTAIFRQIDNELSHTHQDALEFPNGERMLLTLLCEGQEAHVLQLPANPETLKHPAPTRAKARQRSAIPAAA